MEQGEGLAGYPALCAKAVEIAADFVSTLATATKASRGWGTQVKDESPACGSFALLRMTSISCGLLDSNPHSEALQILDDGLGEVLDFFGSAAGVEGEG